MVSSLHYFVAIQVADEQEESRSFIAGPIYGSGWSVKKMEKNEAMQFCITNSDT